MQYLKTSRKIRLALTISSSLVVREFASTILKALFISLKLTSNLGSNLFANR